MSKLVGQRVKIDAFAMGVDSILQDYANRVDKNTRSALRKSISVVKEEAIAGSPECHPDGYKSGWKTRTSSTKNGLHAECGNALKPGLVHLLEKGHNTLNGKRVAGRPHLEPAAEKGFSELEKLLKEL